ncbi:MAG: TPM domain-containing protein [Bacillota bacterium]
MFHVYKTRHFFSTREKKQIMAAIEGAEKLTSGEIRVHVESVAGPDPLARAQRVFENLGMTKTKQRNGVLIYLAVKDRKFAIIGDQGIDQAVPANFWEDTKEKMQALFKAGKFSAGVCLGIELAGEHLAKFFPHRLGDVNELANEISEGE